jgi:Ca2+-transporting ATPase
MLGMRYLDWFKRDGDEIAPEFPPFTLYQASLFFTIYVFFQVWNQFNCRSLAPEDSGLRGAWRNRAFIMILSLTVGVQILIISFGGTIFDVKPLGLVEWLAIAAITASILAFSEGVRMIRRRRTRGKAR